MPGQRTRIPATTKAYKGLVCCCYYYTSTLEFYQYFLNLF